MAADLVGRERELAGVVEMLDAARAGLSVLVLEGEAGIGKTAGWREAILVAEANGFRTLVLPRRRR